jgi:hypothetical protein
MPYEVTMDVLAMPALGKATHKKNNPISVASRDAQGSQTKNIWQRPSWSNF